MGKGTILHDYSHRLSSLQSNHHGIFSPWSQDPAKPHRKAETLYSIPCGRSVNGTPAAFLPECVRAVVPTHMRTGRLFRILSHTLYPMSIGLSVGLYVHNTPLIVSYYIYCISIIYSIPDPFGLSVCRLRAAHKGFACAKTLCRQSLCAHKEFVGHTKIPCGGSNHCTEPLWDGLNSCAESFVGRAPCNLCTLP